jgi:hypothetical protein
VPEGVQTSWTDAMIVELGFGLAQFARSSHNFNATGREVGDKISSNAAASMIL